MKQNVFVWFILVLIHSNASAQPQDTSGYTVKSYLLSYPSDIGGIITSPLHWNRQESITAATVVAGTAGLVLFADSRIRSVILSNQVPPLNSVFKYGFEPFGSGVYSIPTIAIMYVYGAASSKHKPEIAALDGLKGYIISGGATAVGKALFDRTRPLYTSDPLIWKGPWPINLHASFPSGHTISAFTVASIIATEYSDNEAVAIVAYSLATLTGISRIYRNYHWTSDVVFGAAVGYGIGRLIVNRSIHKSLHH